jgi:hypothetical protein
MCRSQCTYTHRNQKLPANPQEPLFALIGQDSPLGMHQAPLRMQAVRLLCHPVCHSVLRGYHMH